MAHLYNIKTTGLRFFTVYAILNDRAINHGKMSRDFTYVDDIVDGD
jgi:UDP-glucuronate 4-epimerase